MKKNVAILILFLTLFSGKAFAQCTIVRTITGPATVCEGSTGNVYTTEASMSEYAWNISTGGIITSGAGTSSITVTWTTAGAQTVSINYKDTDNCTASSATVKNVTVNALPAPTITGSASVCVGTTGVTYTTEASMTGYTWDIPSGGTITGGSTTNEITVTWNTAGARTVSVNYTNSDGCNASSATVKNVTVNSLPVPTITGLASVCVGNTGVTYTTEASMTGYTWDIPSGGTITGGSTTNVITVTWNATGARTVSVNYTNSNGCTAPGATVKNITVNSLPVPTITGSASVCAGTTGVTYTTEASMTGYTWNIPSGGTITGGSTTNEITVTWNTAGARTVSVNYTNSNGCTAPVATVKNITVNALPIPNIAGPDRACITSTGNIYSTVAGMTNYIWDVSSDGSVTNGGGTTNSSVTVTWDDNGAQTVKLNYVDLNGCTATSQTTLNVTVIDKPLPTNVKFTGLLREYATLRASYDYAPDVCFPEVPAETEISWYRANNSSGSSSSLITTKPGTDTTLVLSSTEVGKYIKIKVRLHDGATLMDAVWSSAWLGPVAVNEKPQALTVSVTGTLLLNSILDGNYTYSDAESDAEGGTTFQWYRANDGSGSGSTAITGATAQTYTITTTDRNKFIRFKVTPKAQTGTLLGDAVNSAWVGPVSDNPPVASAVSITGSTRVGSVLTGNYQYTDVDGDAEGTSTLRWYSATSSTGTGSTQIATGKTLLLTNTLIDSYIGFSVTPVAQAGVSPGARCSNGTFGSRRCSGLQAGG